MRRRGHGKVRRLEDWVASGETRKRKVGSTAGAAVTGVGRGVGARSLAVRYFSKPAL